MRFNAIILAATSAILSVSAASIDISARGTIEVDSRTASVVSSVSFWCPSQDKSGRGKHNGKCEKPGANFKKDTFTCYFHNKAGHNDDNNDNDVHACTYDTSNGHCKSTNNSKCPEKASTITKRHFHEIGDVHTKQDYHNSEKEHGSHH